MKANTIKVSFPASFGELVQGVYNGKPFLCSYAVNCYSTVTITRQDYDQRNSMTLPLKSQILLNKLRERLQLSQQEWRGLHIKLENSIPCEKGMGSSTADLAAIMYGVCAFFGVRCQPDEVAKLACGIEPTDSLIYPSLTLMDSTSGNVLKHFPQKHFYSLVGLELPHKVNTLALHQQLRQHVWNEKQQRELYELTCAAFVSQSMDLVFEAAELSARMNQMILKKPHLEELMELKSVRGVKGLNVSHTGSVVGIVYDDTKIKAETMIKLIKSIDSTSLYKINRYNMIPSSPMITIN